MHNCIGISSLSCANKVEIFKHLAVDELNMVNVDILNAVATDYFHPFLEFCDKVYQEKDKIQDISCSIANNQCYFSISYKDNH